MSRAAWVGLLTAWVLAWAPAAARAGEPPSAAKGDSKKGLVEVFLDRGETYLRAGTKQGLKVGSTVQVLGPTIGDTEERRTLGAATVLEVWENLARVSLDAAASADKGEKLARLPTGKAATASAPTKAAPAESPPPVAAAPTSPTSEGLQGRAELNKARVILYNTSSFTWTHCDVRLPSNKHYLLKSLGPGDNEGIMLFRFAQDGIPYDKPNESVLVKCAEGERRFSLSGN